MRKIKSAILLIGSIYWGISGIVYLVKDVIAKNTISNVEWIARLALSIAVLWLAKDN